MPTADERSSEGSEKQQAGSARDDGDAGRADEALEARDAVVRDADRFRLARLVELLVGLPLAQILGAGGLGAGALAVVARAVEQDEVHVVQPEVRQVLQELLLGLRAARRLGHLRARLGLGRDEEGVARQALERGADALLVHVVLGRVDVGEAYEWMRTRSACCRTEESGAAAKKEAEGGRRSREEERRSPEPREGWGAHRPSSPCRWRRPRRCRCTATCPARSCREASVSGGGAEQHGVAERQLPKDSQRHLDAVVQRRAR